MKEEELPKKKRGRKKKIVEPAQIMSGFIPSKYQQDIFDFIQHGNGNSVINALAGSGKCLGVDTEILMYDGSIKKVQDIIVGDKLMGDDSTPRTVLSVTKGYGQLRKIQPKKGDAWVCNDAHILTLSKYISGNKHNKGKFITVDIPINELENNNIIGNTHHTDGDFRMYKLLKTGVKFRENAIDIDPWLYGMWLGDGTTNQSLITNINENVINEIEKTIPNENYIDIKKYRNKCPKINILTNNKHKYNSFRRFVRSSSINNEKFILKNYLINTEEVRLKLLAGLIDSDGYYKKKNYFISTKFDMLAKDILFLCRSLGFSAYDKIKNKKCHNNGVIKSYHNITISGDIEKIPVVTDYKKADKRLINKNVCHVGFRIDKIGEGDYYGFTLDGNGRFLLSDFTITHNTSTIVNAVKLIPPTCNALFIAFNKEIVKELEKKLEGVKNVQVKTLHSLGFLMIRRNLGTNIEIDEYKYRTFIKKNIKQLSSADFDKMTTKLMQQYTDNVIQLCDLGRYNLAQCEKDLLQVSARHDIPIIDDECNAVLNVMKWGRENTTSIDFTDMVWLPYELTLNPIGLQYDYIFIDECFPYEQRISTTYGKLKIGDLYNRFINNKPLPLVKSFNEKTQKFEDKKILNVFNKGERDLIEIIVGGKRKIKCTPNERFLTLNGYQYISELTVGDYILSSTKHQPYHGFLNPDQLDLFKASVIGDGSLNKLSNGVFRCKFIHGEEQKEYIEWKCNMFNQDISEIRHIEKNGFSEKNAYAFSTLGYCIPNNDLDKKEIINNLTIKQLAINYQDNGSYDKNGTMRLYSCVHNEELIDLLIKRIKFFGIECVSKHLSKSSTSNKEYFYISIGVKDSYKLSEMFAPYINKCLQYKIHDDFKHLVNTYKWDNTSSELGGMPITSMKMLSKKEIVYDIEVEDNHNFIITSGSWNTKCETNNEGFIVHNCQDLNAAQRELFLRCFRRGTRFIAVGDKKQSIYSFAGADAESFAKLQNLPNTTTLPLPISYRCPKKVVNLANQFVDTMECREGAPDGEIVHNVSIKDIHDGDMVLCRTKMPLIKLYMRYLRMGVKSYVRGQDIGLNLLRMVDKTEQIVLNVSLQKDGVFARLYDDLFEERNRLMIKRGMDLEDATLSNQIMNKYDSIKALEILAEGLTSARDLHDRIENVFAESADGVCLSTIHKAKGLEANNVYILCKTLMPSRLATQDWEKEQEQNLMYVAYTRAKYKLGFVSETEISPSAGMIDPSAALTELNYIENKICKLLNKTPQVIMDATEVAQYNLKSATIIEEKETNHAEISSNNNEDSDSETMKKLLELVKKKGGIEKFEKFLEQ